MSGKHKLILDNFIKMDKTIKKSTIQSESSRNNIKTAGELKLASS